MQAKIGHNKTLQTASGQYVTAYWLSSQKEGQLQISCSNWLLRLVLSESQILSCNLATAILIETIESLPCHGDLSYLWAFVFDKNVRRAFERQKTRQLTPYCLHGLLQERVTAYLSGQIAFEGQTDGSTS